MDEQQKKKANQFHKEKLGASDMNKNNSNENDLANLHSPYRLVERKKKGIAVLITLEAEQAEKLAGRTAAEFAREKAEELLRAPARLIDESKIENAGGKNGLPVKEFCFIQQKLELL